MAPIRLADYEVERGELPPVCVCCGEAADGETRVRFSWYPGWVNVLILAGLLPWAIVAMILTKRMTAHLPTCPRHRGHWLRQKLLVWGGLLVLLGLGIACVVILAATNQQPGQRQDELAGYLCGSVMLLGLVWLIVVLVSYTRSVKPSEITDRDIVLAKVSPAFVDAVMDRRREHGEPEVLRPYWWAKRRRRRRDYDEEDEYDD